ncbi:hypothetical protein NC652_034104 [Populus alba x Populus x berolinensis]|nr:hypothetical protein NC652_034104 [Populus alba x Populus x berolinensis]
MEQFGGLCSSGSSQCFWGRMKLVTLQHLAAGALQDEKRRLNFVFTPLITTVVITEVAVDGNEV